MRSVQPSMRRSCPAAAGSPPADLHARPLTRAIRGWRRSAVACLAAPASTSFAPLTLTSHCGAVMRYDCRMAHDPSSAVDWHGPDIMREILVNAIVCPTTDEADSAKSKAFRHVQRAELSGPCLRAIWRHPVSTAPQQAMYSSTGICCPPKKPDRAPQWTS